MQLELPRTGLHGSALVELLAQLALTDRPKAPPSFVEGLGRWLGWKEAIALSTVLQTVPEPSPRAPARGGGRPGCVAALATLEALETLEAEFTRVRASLATAIDEALHDAEAGQDGHDFLPWRRGCFRLQQAMDAAVGALRTRARAALHAQAHVHPSLGTLAALDVALAAALAPQEQAQLALMPVLLEKHFMRTRAPDESAQRAAPGAFRHDMRRLLLAELELRLQPALGLLDALRATRAGPP